MSSYKTRNKGIADRQAFGLASARAATLGGNTAMATRPEAFDLRKRAEGKRNLENYSLLSHNLRRQNKLDAHSIEQDRFGQALQTDAARRANAQAKVSIAGQRQEQQQSAALHPERVEAAKESVAGMRQAREQDAALHPERVEAAKESVAGMRQAREQNAALHPERVEAAKESIAGMRQAREQDAALHPGQVEAQNTAVAMGQESLEEYRDKRALEQEQIGRALASQDSQDAFAEEVNKRYSPQDQINLKNEFRESLKFNEGSEESPEWKYREPDDGEFQDFVRAKMAGGDIQRLTERYEIAKQAGNQEMMAKAAYELREANNQEVIRQVRTKFPDLDQDAQKKMAALAIKKQIPIDELQRELEAFLNRHEKRGRQNI